MNPFDDKPYDELDWLRDSEARDRKVIEFERRDMEEIESPAPVRTCCDNPANYTFQPTSGFIDPDTGYAEVSYWRCSCGNLVDDYDFSLLIQWHRDPTPEPDAVPEEIDERTKMPNKEVA